MFCLFANCGNPAVPTSEEYGRFTFCVTDVGQGLAQFGVMDGRAVVWDMGPPGQYAAWRGTYSALGSPRIELIVISHSDDDHYGGLRHLDENINWSGNLAVSPFEDTAKIRASAGAWKERVVFQFSAAGDTIKTFNSVEIICLWPPKDAEPELPLNGATRNRYSLVFSIQHGYSRALVTSDIDSVSMTSIAVRSAYGLRAQILSVPHHGSAGSVNSLFFAYVSAETAVISCARNNSYGHPSAPMIDALLNSGANLLYTYLDNSVYFVSNGYYWY
jgi:competence protein ComEC